jgi:hypothetical protein
VVHILRCDTRLTHPQLKRLINKVVGELSALGLNATALQELSKPDDSSSLPRKGKEKEWAEALPDDASLRTRGPQISKIVYEFLDESDNNAYHLRLWLREGTFYTY